MKSTSYEQILIEQVQLSGLKPSSRNARTHSKKQITTLARAIKEFGFNNPILIDKDNEIVAGHGRLEAATALGLTQVPAIRLEHLTPEQVRAYRIADNRIAELAEWDEAALKLELQELSIPELKLDLTLTGFEMAEIDMLISAAPKSSALDENEPVDLESGPVVTQAGDIWELGQHRIICADSLHEASYQLLLGDELAELIFTDPPYNVPIHGHVLSGAEQRRCDLAVSMTSITLMMISFKRSSKGVIAFS